MAPSRIRVIGSLNADLTTRTPRFPAPGETLTAHSFTTSPGGKGANQAVACARLSRSSHGSTSPPGDEASVQVEMVGAVGKDDGYWTSLLRPAMESCGIDVSGVVEVPGSTGVAVIIVDEGAGGENRILLSPEANYAGMQPDSIVERSWTDPMPEVAVLQAEIPRASIIIALKAAQRNGVDVVFNPAPVPPEGFPDDVFDGLHHLIVNETEAELLTPQTAYLIDRTVSRVYEKIYVQAEHFHRLGVRNVIITLGGRGVFVSSAAGAHAEKPPNTTYTKLIPAERVGNLVDTTAAGDTFVGAYAVEVARWKGGGKQGKDSIQDGSEFDVKRAVMLANKAASVCVQRKGAMDSVPWEDEVFGRSPKTD